MAAITFRRGVLVLQRYSVVGIFVQGCLLYCPRHGYAEFLVYINSASYVNNVVGQQHNIEHYNIYDYITQMCNQDTEQTAQIVQIFQSKQ
jgi:hypothetical protein